MSNSRRPLSEAQSGPPQGSAVRPDDKRTGQAADPAAQPSPSTEYEGSVLSRPEYISAIVHLYRGEVYRATVQRTRLDLTTNWAVLTTAGLLAFSFRLDDNPHWALLMGMLLISLFLVFEARRYQTFDVWRSRVRKIEENFYGPILSRDPLSPHAEWGERVAHDLLAPRYKISFLNALRTRFLRNYWAIFAVLLMSWLLKVLVYPGGTGQSRAETWADVRANLQFGLVAWWIPLLFIAVILAAAAGLVFMVRSSPRPSDPQEGFWVEPPLESAERPRDL